MKPIQNNPLSKRPARGFTLIELLVVVAIISLLVSILMPSLQRAKNLTRRVVCAAQLRTLAFGFVSYSEDYGVFPMPTCNPPCPYMLNGDVAEELTGTYGLAAPEERRAGDWTDYAYDSLWNCPARPSDQGVRAFQSGLFYSDHYMIQTGLNLNPDWEYYGERSPLKPEDPTGPLIADRIIYWPGVHVTLYGNHTLNDLEGYNQAYSDAHVEWYDIQVLDDQRYDNPIFNRPGNEAYFWYESGYSP
jgi:prepilin-type N-terminal cleavage/methylation domain-containing protein